MHIKELEKNKYRVWVDLDPDYTGKRRRKSKVIQAKTKRELQTKINLWTDSINNISECKTVSDMCNEVWPQIIANKSPNTVYGYNAAKKRIDNRIHFDRYRQLLKVVKNPYFSSVFGHSNNC